MPKRNGSKIPESVISSRDHAFATSCVHCTDTGDSRGRYVSTYCHLRNQHLAGFSGDGPVPCRSCPDYAPRPDGRR